MISAAALPNLTTLELAHNYLPQATQALLREHFEGKVRL